MSEPETWLGNVSEAVNRVLVDANITIRASTWFPGDPPREGCTGCGLPLPHDGGVCLRRVCRNCGVQLTEFTAMQAVVNGEVLKPLCRGCYDAKSGVCLRGDR